MNRRLLDKIGTGLFIGACILVVGGITLMVGVETGRRLERREMPARWLEIEADNILCMEYVAELGKELESEKRKNRELMGGRDGEG